MSEHTPGLSSGIDHDIKVGALSRATLILAAVAVAAGLASIGLYLWFDAELSKKMAPPPAIRLLEGERLPAGPHLQAQPETELARLRAQEQQQLDGWGWVDREAGIVRVPVAVAMESVLRTQRPEDLGAGAP